MSSNVMKAYQWPERSSEVRHQDVSHPFGLSWLDSCYQQTMLPNGPWQDKVANKLCEKLVPKLRKQLDIVERRQVLMNLLGAEFTSRYLKNINNAPHVLEEPLLSPADRYKLEKDGENWLQHTLTQTATEIGCQRPVKSEVNGVVQCAEMLEFLEHSRCLFESGLNRHMYTLEQQVQRAEELSKFQKRQKDRAKRIASSPMKKMSVDWETETESETGSRNSTLGPLNGNGDTQRKSSSLFWGHQSNCLGKSVVAILRRDPRRFNQVVGKLHGRQLSGTLRSYIWMDVLQRHERAKMNDLNLEKMLRERFAKTVTRGLVDLSIKDATHSPIESVIEKAVQEIYSETASMNLFMARTVHLKETIKALNVLYVFDRTYEPYLIYWLFPLQLAFQRESGESEHAYELAMYLDLLNKGCFPKWPAIFSVAENVMSRMYDADPVFHQHLKTIATVNPKINNKEFIAHLIQQERLKANRYTEADSQNVTQSVVNSKHFLADPLMFLRKWIGEGFVGILDTPAVVYVWDQLFMQCWNLKAIEDVCLSLVFLLRDKFMMSADYTSMRQVFLSEPCQLYTADLQKSWVFLQQGGSLIDVPRMNRFAASLDITPVKKSPAPNSYVDQNIQPTDVELRNHGRVSIQSTLLHGVDVVGPVGIKDVTVQLVTNSTNSWLYNNFITNKVRLTCTLCFGSIQLQSKTSTLPIVLKDTKIDESLTKTYILAFSAQRFKFQLVDLSDYDLEHEMGGYPNAVLQMWYVEQKGKVNAIGWAKIQLYQRRLEAGTTGEWDITLGEQVCDLHPGLSPLEDNQDVLLLITSASQLRATIYEPSSGADR